MDMASELQSLRDQLRMQDERIRQLSQALGVLQDKGFKVALVTDGRMSGASGKVPAAIHVTPEALPSPTHAAGPLAYVRDGDVIRLCAHQGLLLQSNQCKNG